MDANELIDEYLAEHVDAVINRQEDWQSYTDPFTGKKVWYDQEQLWDLFRANNDPLTYTKLLLEPMSIP